MSEKIAWTVILIVMVATIYTNIERVKSNTMLAGEMKAFRLVLESAD